ncbi:hypothetical protein L7F22_004036 [Adiantum nelumboides]|nr:hypothetical protein [Adiantum nelumboides]
MAATSPKLDDKDAKNLEEQAPLFAQDGSVDIKGQPVLKSKTGNWKACPFILGNETSSVNVTNWSGTCYITPLIGAFLADAYLGRYWTIAVFSAIYFVGMVLLTLTTAVPSLVPPKTGSATVGQLAAFYLALYLIALGTGGIKPCVSSFGADQFDENDAREKKNKASKARRKSSYKNCSSLTAAFSKRSVSVLPDSNFLYETTDCSIQGSRKLEHTDFFW